MASVTDIANAALIKLGQETITSINDESARATICRKLYPEVRDAVLRAHPWNCAIARASLNQNKQAPAYGRDYSYQLPTDPYCLRVLDTDDEDDEWMIEGRDLVSDNSSVLIRYVKRIENPGEFDSLLYEAIVHRLACEIAYPTAGSVRKSMEMWKLYAAKIKEAWGVDGQEGRRGLTQADDLIDVRL